MTNFQKKKEWRLILIVLVCQCRVASSSRLTQIHQSITKSPKDISQYRILFFFVSACIISTRPKKTLCCLSRIQICHPFSYNKHRMGRRQKGTGLRENSYAYKHPYQKQNQLSSHYTPLHVCCTYRTFSIHSPEYVPFHCWQTPTAIQALHRAYCLHSTLAPLRSKRGRPRSYSVRPHRGKSCTHPLCCEN